MYFLAFSLVSHGNRKQAEQMRVIPPSPQTMTIGSMEPLRITNPLRLHFAVHRRGPCPLSPQRCAVHAHTGTGLGMLHSCRGGFCLCPSPAPTSVSNSSHWRSHRNPSSHSPSTGNKNKCLKGEKKSPDNSLQVETRGFIRDSSTPGLC